jgi:ABC-type Fe3+/spermidine/putrescine transport system ATPase subunit
VTNYPSPSKLAVAARGASVEVLSCRHSYGSVEVLGDIDLRAAAGELITLLGQSGSGKTTLLRIIAGLVLPTKGMVRIDGRDVTRLPPEKRDIGMVFQNYALFPHLNVLDNVGFPLRVRGIDKNTARQRVDEALQLVGLPGLGHRFPSQLSGGQQQRVAVARAIVFRPRVLLMDEPLGSLDKRLRQQLQVDLRRLQKEVAITTIYVTHDQDEAFAISDRIAVIDRGHILQIASPSEIYRAPANRFVADFVGDLNCFQGIIRPTGDGLALQTKTGLEIRIGARDIPLGGNVSCGIRPERVRVGETSCHNLYTAKLRTFVFKGSRHWAEARLPTGEALQIELDENTSLRQGDEICVGWNKEDVHIFAADNPGLGKTHKENARLGVPKSKTGELEWKHLPEDA